MHKTKVRSHRRRINNKVVRVKNHERAVISSKKRKLFSNLSNKHMEVGGYLDFDKGKGLHNVNMHFGDKYGVDFPHDPDYEVQWHTHPNISSVSVLPSYEDLVSMKDSFQKEQVIFTDGLAISIYEGEKFKKTNDSSIKKVVAEMYEDMRDGLTDRQVYDKYKPIFKEKLGLHMSWHGKGRDILLKSKVV